MSVGELTRDPAGQPETSSQKRLSGRAVVLAVCCVAQFMVILDLSIVNVALPSIQVSLGSPLPTSSGSSTRTRSCSPAS